MREEIHFDVQISHKDEDVVITLRDPSGHATSLYLDEARANWWRECIWLEQMRIHNEKLEKGT